MSRAIDFDKLSAFFPPEDIEWKPIAVSKKTSKGLAAAYLTNRAIMDRLDEVCGPENWRNEFQAGPDGGVVCGLSIKCGDEWVTKWDGAENTDIEAVKGGLSSSMRRAAVQWGIGRYLYRLPQQWVAVDERGRFAQPPRVPAVFHPEGGGDGAASRNQAAPAAAPAAAPSTSARPARSGDDAPAAKAKGRRRTSDQANAKGPDAPSPSGAADEYFMPDDLPF